MPERIRYADLVALPSLDEIKARKTAAKAAKLAEMDRVALLPEMTSTPGVIETPGVVESPGEPKIRPARTAQDGHSLVEQTVYDFMWKGGGLDTNDRWRDRIA